MRILDRSLPPGIFVILSVLLSGLFAPVAISQTVSSVLLSSLSPNPAIAGVPITFTAEVSENGPVPTGTITFSANGTALGTSILDPTGTATFAYTYTAAGSYSITASYSGDGAYSAGVSAPINETITSTIFTTTTLTSSLNPASTGQTVTFSVSLQSAVPSVQNPTGAITFCDGGTDSACDGGILLGKANVVTSGSGTNHTASISTSSLSAGSHQVKAFYSGDNNFSQSASANVNEIVQASTTTATPTSTTLALASNPSTAGQAVTITATVATFASGAPTGVVTFSDGTFVLGTSELNSSGEATLITSSLSAGTHAIQAQYGGDTNDAASASAIVLQQVTPALAPTALALSISDSQSTVGESLTFTATVTSTSSAPAVTPTGSVSFTAEYQDGTTILLDTITLDQNGIATTSTASLAAGAYSITAAYSGDTIFGPGSSSSSFVVNSPTNVPTAITVTASANPSYYGQAISFMAGVTGSSGVPGGTVIFVVTNGASTPAIAFATLDSSGQAVFTSSELPVGANSITAAYSGDSTFAGVASPSVTQTVDEAPTTIRVNVSPNPAAFGGPVTATATVTSTTAGVPTGVVRFSDGATILGAGTLDGNGKAQLITSTLSIGSHSIVASYNGDGNFQGSKSGPQGQRVNQAPTTTTVTSSATSSPVNVSVTFTATVTPTTSGVPTGSVTFFDGATSIGSGMLDGTGHATVSVSNLSVGAHNIGASYGGDTNFLASTSSSLAETITSSMTTVSSSANPSTYGQTVSFTATISAYGNPLDDGTVIFNIGGVNSPSISVSAGQAVYTTSNLSPGSIPVIATYSGDSSFTSSISSTLTQIVNKAFSKTTITSSVNPSVSGQSVTFTANVTDANGIPLRVGSVTFNVGGTISAPISITGGFGSAFGQAVLTTSALTVGAIPVTATYSGNTNFASSTSPTLTQNVNGTSSTTTSVTSSPNPSVYGQAVTFTATVTAPGNVAVNGAVTFSANGTTLGQVSLVNGQGSLTTSALTVGSDAITATFSSSDGNSASSTGSLTQTVNAASTSTSIASSANPSVYGQSVTFTATLTTNGGTASGKFTFTVNGVSSAPVSLVNGQASFTTGALTIGSNSATATFTSSDGTSASSTASLTQTVNPASTTTSLASSANPSAYGQSVTFTATLTTNGGTANGKFSFTVNGVSSAPVSLVNGQASFTTAGLTLGFNSVTATFTSSDGTSASSTASLTQTVNPASTTASLASSANPSVYGQSVTFTATVTGIAGLSGMVTFNVNGVSSAPVTLINGQASLTTAALPVGSNSVSATFTSSDGNSASSTASLTQTVNPASTTTNLASSANPSVYGQPVTFTVTVTGIAGLSGTVTFAVNGVSSAPVPLVNGQASLTTAALTVGSISVSATFKSADGNSASSTASLTQTVNPATTTTSLASSVNPSVYGQTVTFTATVTGIAGLSGTVTFAVNGVSSAPVPLVNGQASLTTAALTVGSNSVSATFKSADGNSASSTASLTQTVNLASTTTTIASSANPSAFGQPVTLTATVTGIAGLSGTVTFAVNGVSSAPMPLVNGQASLTTSALSVGSITVTATFNSTDGNSASSTASLTQKVNPAPTTTTVASSANPSLYGQPVTFTAIVTGASNGTITFTINGVSTAPVPLVNGQASSTSSALPVGSITVTATFNSTDGNSASSTASLTQSVNPASTSTAVASSANPSLYGQPVTFTATVTGASNGTIIFTINGVSSAPVPLVNGQASSTTSALPVGSITVAATFNSADGNSASSTASLTQTVNPAPTTTTLASSANPSPYGQPVTFTATVTGVSTGTITFTINGVSAAPVPLVNGQASSTTSALPVGSITVTATFKSADGNSASSTASLTQTINPASTSTMLASSTNPSLYGQPVTFTTTVTGASNGTITFIINGVSSAPVPLVNGQASSTTSALPIGSMMVTATFNSADGNSASSTASLTQTVNPAPTTTTVASSFNPSVYGQALTFTATVSSSGGTSAGTVTFTLTFSTGSLSSGPVAVNAAGQAAFTPSVLPAGTTTVTAVYSGSGNFTGSASAPIVQTVGQAATMTAVTSSQNPAIAGAQITFTIMVGSVVGTPTGSITLLAGGVNIGSATLDQTGQAHLMVSILAAGTYAITAMYNGSANYQGSTSAPLTQTVTLAPPPPPPPNTTADLAIVDLDGDRKAASGDTLTYNITVGNLGPGSATAVVLTDSLPAGTTFLRASSNKDGTCTTPAVGQTGTVTCTLASLTKSAKWTVRLRVTITAPKGSTVNDTASVSSSTPDPNAVNNSATVTTAIGAGHDHDDQNADDDAGDGDNH